MSHLECSWSAAALEVTLVHEYGDLCTIALEALGWVKGPGGGVITGRSKG